MADPASLDAQHERIALAGSVIVSILVTIGFVGLLAVLVMRPVEHNTLLEIMIGVLATQFGAVVQYWVGSSYGSMQKNRQIGDLTDMAKRGPEGR